jgi:hypothetical protein
MAWILALACMIWWRYALSMHMFRRKCILAWNIVRAADGDGAKESLVYSEILSSAYCLRIGLCSILV